MTELVDVRDLKSRGESRAGSSPVGRTTKTVIVWTLRQDGLSWDDIVKYTGINKRLAQQLIRARLNRDKINGYAATFREGHREHLRQYRNAWRARNIYRVREHKYRAKCRECGVEPNA